jgi:hypothetical protein
VDGAKSDEVKGEDGGELYRGGADLTDRWVGLA